MAKKKPTKTISIKTSGKKPASKKAAAPKAKSAPTNSATTKPAAAKKAPARGLGRGLSALMDDVSLSTFISDDIQIVDDISDTPEGFDIPITDSPEMDRPEAQASNPSALETKDAGQARAEEMSETKSMAQRPPRGKINPDDPYDLSNYPKLSEEEQAAELAEVKAEMIAKLGADPETGARSPLAIDYSSTPSSDHNTGQGVHFVEMGQLERNPEQPRRHFDSQLLEELTNSIRQKGILQPILVRPIPGKERRNKPVYQVVAGERRWQAAMSARLDAMPVFVREITDQEALEIGVIENVQRAELNPMEEAMAYKALTAQFGRTQEDVAKAVGKSRSYVANMMRLINLPEKVQDYLAKGDISTGHARAIIAAPDPTEMADAIVENELSVRDAEDWARKLKTELTAPKQMPKGIKGADERRLEAQLMDALGLSVDLKHRGPGGELRVKYKTADQLDEIVLRLMGKG